MEADVDAVITWDFDTVLGKVIPFKRVTTNYRVAIDNVTT